MTGSIPEADLGADLRHGFVTTSDGARLHYVEAGTGKPLLLVGGWCMSTPWWTRQLQGLNDEFRVVALDSRAYGESDNVVHGHRMARHAADVRDVVGALDLNGAVAIGWSLGANVLLSHWELFGGAGLSGLVHVDQTPYCLNTDDWNLGFGTEEEARAFLEAFAADQRAGAENLVRLCLTAEPEPTFLKTMVEELLKTPVEAALALEHDHIWSDWRDVAPLVDLPVLVVTGALSKLFPPDSGAWLAEHLPKGTQVLLKASGHCPFLEDTEKFNDAVREFVRSLG